MLSAFAIYAQQPITGNWAGNLHVQSAALPLVFTITDDGGTLKASILSPMQSQTAMNADSINFTDNHLEIFIKAANAGYSAIYEGDSLKGIFKQNGMAFPLNLKRSTETEDAVKRPQTPQPPFNYNIEEVSFRNEKEGNLLAGTLTTPGNKKDIPIVIMITGSGAQDRDETILGHKPFWVIAHYFAKNGIGALRMDDRGTGSSEVGKKDATSADFATDIETAVSFLKDKGYNKIGLLGHSEGGMIAPMVASRDADVKFIVSMAGPGIPIPQLMVLQTEAVLESNGISKMEAEKAGKESAGIYDFINNYKGNDLKAGLKAKFLDALSEKEGYTASGKDSIRINSQAEQLSSAWFRYFLKYDPAQYIQQLKIPVLAINGSKDVQVTPAENLDGWQKALKGAGNKKYEIKELPGLNHLFQEAETGSASEYATIEQTISPKALEIMKDWILKINSML